MVHGRRTDANCRDLAERCDACVKGDGDDDISSMKRRAQCDHA
jgi:hypothetical protein